MQINIVDEKYRLSQSQSICKRLWQSRLVLVSIFAIIGVCHWLSSHWGQPRQIDTHIEWKNTPIKAALVMVAREQDLYAVHATMQDVQDRFNKRSGYPWVILSDQPFSDRFRQIVSATRGMVYFGRIPAEQWNEPAWVDIKMMELAVQDMVKKNVLHGESISWRKMSRYNVGFIADHPLLQDAEYYWKVQPGSRYVCDLDGDPFQYMKANDKKLAYAITMSEDKKAIPTLWSRTLDFLALYNSTTLPPSQSIFPWIVEQGLGNTGNYYEGDYNGNHIWNNFMIISLDFLRSQEYRRFFQYLDSAGGFFYERWGDAPVQTIAAALFLHRDQIHFMQNFGYFYSVATQCPSNHTVIRELRCTCDPDKGFLFHGSSRTKQLLQLQSFTI
ncbi:nucleotide-diphospho-sugar transferase [Fennellomyces sp. T-0311]|nr:nucleotide-diphospho-sugar transferase [Fennellomyces sp. T-0311]